MPFAFAGTYGPQAITDSSNTPLPNLPVAVYVPTTTTTIPLYTDRSMQVSTENPTSTDELGNLTFYCAPGTYDIVGNGTRDTVIVSADPGDVTSKAGDEMTGLLILSGDPVDPLGAASKEYVDSAVAAGGGGGGGGGNSVLTLAFAHDKANLSIGASLAEQIPVGKVLLDWWLEIDTAWNVPAFFDLGTNFASSPLGFLGQVGANPIPLSVADAVNADNPGFALGMAGSSFASALASLAGVLGPPVGRPQTLVKTLETLEAVVSQDGKAVNPAVAATLTAAVAPVGGFPYPVTTNANNNFFFNGSPAGGGAQEKFTIAQNNTPGYASLAALATAIAAATGTASDTFGQYCAVSNNGTELVLTAMVAGAAANGNVLSAGPHDALAGLGFTGTNQLGNTIPGAGGDPGATQGSAILYLLIGDPS